MNSPTSSHFRRSASKSYQKRQFGDNHKVKLGRNRSKTNGVELRKMASGLWVSLRYFPAVDAPASETAAVMDQMGAKLENSKTISGVVAQSVRALPSQCRENNESGLQNRASKLPWPVVWPDHRCKWLHFAKDIAQNLMSSARLNEANP